MTATARDASTAPRARSAAMHIPKTIQGHIEAATDAMLDEHPGLADFHVARAEMLAGRVGRTVDELVDEIPGLAGIRGIIAPGISALAVMGA